MYRRVMADSLEDLQSCCRVGADKGPGDDAGAVGQIEDASLRETILKSSRTGGAVTVSPERVA